MVSAGGALEVDVVPVTVVVLELPGFDVTQVVHVAIGHQHFFSSEGRDDGGRVDDYELNHAVDERPPFLKIVFVSDVLIGDVADEIHVAEGSRGHQVLGIGQALHLPLAQNYVPGSYLHALEGDRWVPSAGGKFKSDLYRLVVDGLGALVVRLDQAGMGPGLVALPEVSELVRVHDAFEGEDHVIRGDRGPVGPVGVGMQKVSEGLAVLGHLPAGAQVAHQVIGIVGLRIVHQQPVVQGAQVLQVAVGGFDQRLADARGRIGVHGDRAPILGLRGRRWDAA